MDSLSFMSHLLENIFDFFEDIKEKINDVAYSQGHLICKYKFDKDCIDFKCDKR